MIELKNICYKKDNKIILNNINLKLEDHKFYVITGPNGSGKSTLAKIIMGLLKPTSGKIIYNNEDITTKKVYERAKMGIAFAFQQPITFKGLTIYDLLKIAIEKDITKKDACQILSKVGLCAKEYIDREVNTSLSGGELKRIEIASVLARQANVSIFDEPEAGIDLWSFKYLTGIFQELSTNSKGITIIISHQERLLNTADEIILLEKGTIVKQGLTQEILPIIYNTSNKKGDQNE